MSKESNQNPSNQNPSNQNPSNQNPSNHKNSDKPSNHKAAEYKHTEHKHAEHHIEISEKLHKIAFHLSKVFGFTKKIKQSFIGRKINAAYAAILTLFSKLEQQPMLQLVVFMISITVFLEILSHRSIVKGVMMLFKNPLMFAFNLLIVLLSLSMASFFKRKNFVFLLVFIFWAWLGITNFILLSFRTTPLTAIDFHIINSVFGIIHVYLNNSQLAVISVVVGFVLLGVVYAFRKLPKSQVQYKNAFFVFCCTIVLMIGVSNLAVRAKAVTNDFGNLAQAFHDFGFAYCFTLSILDRGISEPKEYSTESMEVVIDTIEAEISTPVVETSPDNSGTDVVVTPTNAYYNSYKTPIELIHESNAILTLDKMPIEEVLETPNIIMVQLESFIDVKNLVNYTFSDDPTPTFTQLKKDYSSGYLTVPSIGAGTANTEFEIISGMSLDFFGAGEYPYKTILKDTTCESICYDLDELGYHSHAIHNNTGTFYSRNKVFPKLGFESFSSIEYMENVEYNPLGWAKDKVLTSEIVKALKATKEKDFIYTISVQPHGKYPDNIIDENQFITMSGDVEDVALIKYEYYIEQLHEVDLFIKELLVVLEKYKEPTLVVLFGDHLPSLDIEDIDLVNGNKFQTEYVLWSNYPLENVKKDVFAYQLNAYVLERAGIDNGILTKFHQANADLPNYQEELLLLQYDMLYGDLNVFGGVNPHMEKNLTMGIVEILIEDVEQKGETLFVTGENFTLWSEVYIDGSKKDTWFVDENTLIVDFDSLDEVERIEVAQVTDSDKVLSRSEAWLTHNTDVDGDFEESDAEN